MEIKLYQILEESELKEVLISMGADVKTLALTEIMDEEADLFGDFIVFKKFLFKKTYGGYQCMQTDKQAHRKVVLNIMKAKGDRGRNYFMRYKTSKGGRPSFNPVTKTGGFEEVNKTKKRLDL